MKFFRRKKSDPSKQMKVAALQIDLTDSETIAKSLDDIFLLVAPQDIPMLVLAIYENIDDPEEQEIFRLKADDKFKKAFTDEIAKSIGW